MIETSKPQSRVPHDESIVSGERKGRGRNAVGGGPMNGLTKIIESLRLVPTISNKDRNYIHNIVIAETIKTSKLGCLCLKPVYS